MLRLLLLPLPLLIGCKNQYGVVNTEDIETDEVEEMSEEELQEMWQDATLVIHAPASGDFLPWGDAADFDAVVYDADGEATDFEEIAWISNVDDAWEEMGSQFSSDSLDVGNHALTAIANLPNGDRLAYTIGGVLVQSIYAGTYTGTVTVDATYDAYTLGCAGATTIMVDVYGEEVTGDASCIMSLQGVEMETAYVLDLANEEGVLVGDAAVDIMGFQIPMGFDGSMSDEGQIDGTFGGSVLGYLDLEGSLDATRISRDTEFSE